MKCGDLLNFSLYTRTYVHIYICIMYKTMYLYYNTICKIRVCLHSEGNCNLRPKWFQDISIVIYSKP